MDDRFPLRVVDGRTLGDELRAVLKPGETMRDRQGRERVLPVYFIEIPSWEAALETSLAPSFALYEFIDVDVREAAVAREFPRYLPWGAVHLAAHLEILRREFDTYVHIAANGGYRTPGHNFSEHASPHLWGTAANIYRVGDDWLEDEETITRYGERVRDLLPGAWVRPFGEMRGMSNDHLHVDVGFLDALPSLFEDGAADDEEAEA
jgi:hypothetical protein